MRFSRFGAVAAALLFTLGVAACGAGKTATTSPPTTGGSSATTTTGVSTTTPASGATLAITIKNFEFSPNPAHVKVGQTVTVTNLDDTDHSLTANNGSFNTGVFSSGTKTLTFNTPGTFQFHCMIHNFMTGTIIVTQ